MNGSNESALLIRKGQERVKDTCKVPEITLSSNRLPSENSF